MTVTNQLRTQEGEVAETTALSLRDMRKRAGLSQADLGSLLEVAGGTISSWESGKARVP